MTNYVTASDVAAFLKLRDEILASLGRALPTEFWHYTDANGLIGILESGKIWATQVSCLNDSLEHKYFGDLVLEEVRRRLTGKIDPVLATVFGVGIEALAHRDFSAAGHFVSCFSEVEDDLGQWRGYGGGQCGYAIGFDVTSIFNSLERRGLTLMLPMNYDEAEHARIVQRVVDWASQYLLAEHEKTKPTDLKIWSGQMLEALAFQLDLVASILKHPKFSSEKERRILTMLGTDEHLNLEFRQKQTLLARHLPLDTFGQGDPPLLPITRVYIGPGPAQQVSKVSVGDLLLKYGYKGRRVELSKVPYRVP